MMLEWDEAKRAANEVKHGIDFVRAGLLFDGRPTVSFTSPRADEERYLTIGDLDGRLYTVVWTRRGDVIRLISARRARREEEKRYRSLHGC
jgi:uncharacterized DUF497 family protein